MTHPKPPPDSAEREYLAFPVHDEQDAVNMAQFLELSTILADVMPGRVMVTWAAALCLWGIDHTETQFMSPEQTALHRATIERLTTAMRDALVASEQECKDTTGGGMPLCIATSATFVAALSLFIKAVSGTINEAPEGVRRTTGYKLRRSLLEYLERYKQRDQHPGKNVSFRAATRKPS